MKFLKHLTERGNLAKALTVTYNNVTFTKGFSQFLEALSRDGLRATDSVRILFENKHRWNDTVKEGGISLDTTEHPMLKRNFAGDVTIVGVKDALDRFANILNLHEVEFEGAAKPEHIELKYQYHDELNPKFWDGDTLKEDVVAKLLENAEQFMEFMKAPKLQIEDITLTGSNANYNWTELSDVDLHVIVDMEQAAEEYGELVKEYFEAKKKVWNDLHNIVMVGQVVEFYVQDKNEPHSSSGVYSLLHDSWVTEPKHQKPTVDDAAVKAKAAALMNEIDAVLDSNKAIAIEAVMEKITKMRKAGLADKGEFSVENIAFKVLRDNGYLEKLSECKTKIFDRTLSIEDEEESWASLTQH